MTVDLSCLAGAAAQFFDDNGDPLSGGKVYTYAAGSTTPLTTYTSSTGSAPHTNPIILDAAGRVPGGEIWLTENNQYKFIVKTSTNVQIGSYDNIYATSDVTLPINATDVNYTPPYTSAVASNVQAKLAQLVSVRDFGAVGDGVTDDTAAIQTAITVSNGNVDFGSYGTFYVTGPIGLPTNTIYSENTINLVGNGAVILVGSSEAIFTSQRSLSEPDATSNLYTGKINVSGLNFKGATTSSVVFNGDRLYNLYVTGCNFDTCGKVIYSYRSKGSSYPDGYLQSVAFIANHFSQNTKIVDAKRAFNFIFANNFCEANTDGIYIDGTGDPAISSLRVVNNLFEAGGVFLKTGAVLGGVISGNYFEANTIGDVPALKCHIYMVRTTGGFTSGVIISNNNFQASTSQKTDADFRDIKFSGANTSAVKSPVLIGNWSNSYQLVSENVIATAFGNGATSETTLTRARTAQIHTEQKVSFASGSMEFLASTYLSAGVFTVCLIDATNMADLSQSQRPVTMDLNLFLQQRTAGNVVVGACVAKVSLVFQGAEGNPPANDPGILYCGATLVSFAEIPNGSEFDTVYGSVFRKHFTAPVLTVTSAGTNKYYLNLSGYSAPSVANYGAASKILSFATAQMYCLNNSIVFTAPVVLN